MSIDGRLSVVETRIEQIMEEGQCRKLAQKEMLDKLITLQETVNDLNSTIVKYKGFIGGIIFVVGAVTAFLSKFGTLIWQKFHG